jgi:signal transduction histidine kinase/ActR/RegA family two-component response regulator
MKLTPTAAAVPLLLLLLTWLLLRGMDPEAERFDRALQALDDFKLAESSLHRDVLSARAGLLRNYDPLVREVNSLRNALGRLREAEPAGAAAAAIGQLAALTDRQEELTEQFKSDNALLQNSLASFGLLSARLGAANGNAPIVPAVSALAAAMLTFVLDTSPEAASEVADRLDAVARQPYPSTDAEAIEALLAHGKLLHNLLPATDGTLQALLAVPSGRGQEAVRAMVMADQVASRARARDYRLLLYATSLILLGFLARFGLKLRHRARTREHHAAFEHLIAGISTRFIDAQPQEIAAQIERALGEIAAYLGADRAYLVLPARSSRIHAWHAAGIGYPPGWPDRAPALAARFEPTAEGIVHVTSVDRLRPGADRDALAAVGMHGWACAMRVSEGSAESILGFDALRLGTITRPGELGLLRMALDVISNAVRREDLERERGRLEARLQQARRMETVGALASGIAHNFNNLVGAILGHAEIAEAQLSAASRSARHLEAIRRAGERARDLVDQILDFGRRRDARRRPVNLRTLLGETAALLRATWPASIELAIREVPEAAVVSGEPGQLQQVILNLCNNAMQAMDGAGRIEVDTDLQDVAKARALSHGEIEPGPYVRLAVSDTGRGMDAAVLERIFEPFFTTRSGGNGLGLATVREILREHGGAIEARSTLGLGSRFEVWLPCIARADGTRDESRPALPFGRGQTLLVVDNDHARLLRDEEMLAALGYEPVGFTRAAEALAACRAAPERFDALLVGHLAPLRSALQVAAALHEIAPGLPLLLATAAADGIGAAALMAAGIAEVVRQPLVSAEIAAALARCLAIPRGRARGATAVTRFTGTEITQ